MIKEDKKIYKETKIKDKTILSSIGILIFFIMTAIDKFYFKIPTFIYIPIGILSIILIIIGFTKDKRKTSSKKQIKIIITATFITILLVVIYLNPYIVYNNYKLTTHIKEELNNKEITNLIPFDYDKAYIIHPYTSKEDIEKEIGITSRFIKDNEVNDNIQEIIVIKNNQVIASTFISLNNNKFSIQTLAEDNVIENNNSTYFYVTKEGDYSYLIEFPYTKEETYNNISFTIPGIWCREDNEESSRMYYLDIEENIDYMTISKVEDFSYKKYKKTIKDKLSIEKDISTKYFTNIKYLELDKDNDKNEIEYIISINEETYIFSLSTQNKNKESHQESLLNVINSIQIISN